MSATLTRLPTPPHFDAGKISEIRPIRYLDLLSAGKAWAKQNSISPAAADKFRISLMLIDEQLTFCHPDFELFVSGAPDDTARVVRFLYENAGVITETVASMDTHFMMQIFHPTFWVNEQGEHPAPVTPISVEDILKGVWKVNPAVVPYVVDWGKEAPNLAYVQRYALHYARSLEASGKYALIVWPFHGMIGGIGHALVPAIEEACFFHGVARSCQPQIETKGGNFLTENYSVLGPEVLVQWDGSSIAQKNVRFIERLMKFDAVIIAGQAKSHCVAWTIADLLGEIKAQDPKLASKVYLLEDCTSPVIVPGVVDYTDEANAAFQRFADAGMNIVRTDQAIETWPGIQL